LVVAAVVVLVVAGRLAHLQLLRLEAVAVAEAEEQNCGFPLRPLALLKQLLLVQEALAVLPELLTIQVVQPHLMEVIHLLDLGRFLEVEPAPAAAQLAQELLATVLEG
jgi:hypothetical protein